MTKNKDRIVFCESMIILYDNKLRRGVAYPSFFRRAIRAYEEEIRILKGEK